MADQSEPNPNPNRPAAHATDNRCEGCGEPLEVDGSVYVCHPCQRAWPRSYYDEGSATAAPTRYYVAKKAGRLLGRLFYTDDILKVCGQVDVDSAILREITEAEWRELVVEYERLLAERFPEAAREPVDP